jgi:hypothetical protein
MPAPRKPVDLGFAEFATQLVSELHEALLFAQDEQEARRAKLADLAAVPADQFARRFITNQEIDLELTRLFPDRRGTAHQIRVGAIYSPATTKRSETPPIQTKFGVRLTSRDLRVRGKRTELGPNGVKTIREAVRARLAEARLKALRQAASQGMPRLVIDSGRVNVKLSFRLAELEKAGARPGKAAAVPLSNIANLLQAGPQRPRYRLMVRQVNEQTMPVPPTEGSGIGELDLTFKTI